MNKFIDEIFENLKCVLKDIAEEDGQYEDNSVENALFYVKNQVEQWDFETLDSFYENGLEGNISEKGQIGDLWCLAVGYALIERYNLDTEEYRAWVEKQDISFKKYLLRLIGENIVEETEKITSEESWKIIWEALDSQKRVIDYTTTNDVDTGFTLFGKPIIFNDKIDFIAESLYKFNDIFDYAYSIFENELQRKCKDYKQCSENIIGILQDSTSAAWIKCRKYLRKQNLEEERIERLGRQYKIKIEEIYEIKGTLDNILNSFLENAAGKVSEIAIEDMKRRGRTFSGGGFGIGGAVTGMIGAGILNKINTEWADACTRASGKELKKYILEKAEEIYLGEETRKIYKDLIEGACKELRELYLDEFCPDCLVDQGRAEEMIDMVQNYVNETDEITSEQYKKLLAYVLFIFPFNNKTYEYLFTEFTDIRGELNSIARKLHMEEYIQNTTGWYLGTVEDTMFFSDIRISEKGEHKVLIDSLEYCGYKYLVELPMDISFWANEDDIKLLGASSSSLAQNVGWIKDSTNEVILIWGGEEGKETFFEEAYQNNSQILDRVNDWELFAIKDFLQEVIVKNTGDQCRQIIHGELTELVGKQYDAMLMIYMDEDVYFCICIGSSGKIDRIEEYKEILENVDIVRKNNNEVENKKFPLFLSKIELNELKKDKLRLEAKNYFSSHREELDLQFSLYFRMYFKTLFFGQTSTIFNAFQNNIMCRYDYMINNEAIRQVLSDEHKGQYILYFSSAIAITDYYVFVWDAEKKRTKIALKDICEIVFVESNIHNFGFPETKMCIRLLENKYVLVTINKSNLSEYQFVCDLINLSLERLIPKGCVQYYQDLNKPNQKKLVFCEKCGEITGTKVDTTKFLKPIYCKKCNASSKFLDEFIKDKNLSEIQSEIDIKLEDLKEKGCFKDEEQLAQLHTFGDIIIEKGNKKLIDAEMVKSIRNNYSEADLTEILQIRVLLRLALEIYGNKHTIVNQYDYQLDSPILATFFEGVSQKGQYILYSENGIIITDQKIYIETEKGNYEFTIGDIIEILPLAPVFYSECSGICLKLTDRTEKMYFDAEFKKYLYLVALINIVLEIRDTFTNISEKRWYANPYTEEKKRILYCGNCRKWSYIEREQNTILDDSRCERCKSSLHFSNVKSYVICFLEDIQLKRNKIKANIDDTLESLVAKERRNMDEASMVTVNQGEIKHIIQKKNDIVANGDIDYGEKKNELLKSEEGEVAVNEVDEDSDERRDDIDLEEKLREVEFYYEQSKQKKEALKSDGNFFYYSKAQNILNKLVRIFENDYRIWWELSKPVDFQYEVETKDGKGKYGFKQEYFEKALDLASIDNKRKIISILDEYNKKKMLLKVEYKKKLEEKAREEEKIREEEKKRRQEEIYRKQEQEKLRQEKERQELLKKHAEEEKKKQEQKARREEEEKLLQERIRNLNVQIYKDLTGKKYSLIDSTHFEYNSPDGKHHIIVFKEISHVLYIMSFLKQANMIYRGQSLAVCIGDDGEIIKYDKRYLRMKGVDGILRVSSNGYGGVCIGEWELSKDPDFVKMVMGSAKKQFMTFTKIFL